MQIISRRRFIQVSTAAAAASLLPGARAQGANGDLRVAAIGFRSRGGVLIDQVIKAKGARLVAVCDADRDVLAKKVQDLDKKGHTVDAYQDLRDVLARKDIDVVVSATPNHWHSLLTIWACQAGKDVYIEKPVSHAILEGRKMADAARKYQRVVQGGFQNRSDNGLTEFYPWLFAGNLGKVLKVRGLCYRNRASIGKRDTPLTPPESVDYNLWLGPADDQPLFRPQLHYDWHWDFNTGNGDIGNQGPHEMDLCRWALNDPGLPTSVQSFGGRFGWDDAGNTPNMQAALYDFNGTPVLFEVRDMRLKPDVNASPSYGGIRVGVIITGEGGEFRGGRGGGWVYDPDGKKVKQFPGDAGGDHMQNFIDACHSRKQDSLRAPVESAHLSSALSHMANLSYRVGRTIAPGALAERMQDQSDGTDMLDRFNTQLAAWNIDFDQEPWTLGPRMSFDPKTEKFTGPLADRANALDARAGRGDFRIPNAV